MTSAAESPTERPGRSHRVSGSHPTRISWTWATLFVGVALGIVLVDFLAQNTRSVRIEFFSASGHVPIVVALLVAALAGAALVLVVGVARMGQLRRRPPSRGVAPQEMASPASEQADRSAERVAAGEAGASGGGAPSPTAPAQTAMPVNAPPDPAVQPPAV